MFGACTPIKFLQDLDLHTVHRYPDAVRAAAIPKHSALRATCRITGPQIRLIGKEIFGRSSTSEKLVLSTYRSSAAEIGAASQMNPGLVIVIMGVSGAGKSTIGELLSKDLDCPFLDADDFHSPENKEKMRNGIPLNEDDRWPWLETLRDGMAYYVNNGKTAILACSALRRSYRCILRSAAAGNTTGKVMFVHLTGSYELFASRIAARQKEGKHFMPQSLLQSQLDVLEVEDETDVVSYLINVDTSLSPPAIVNHIKRELHAKDIV